MQYETYGAERATASAGVLAFKSRRAVAKSKKKKEKTKTIAVKMRKHAVLSFQTAMQATSCIMRALGLPAR